MGLDRFVKVHVPTGDGVLLTIDLEPRPGVADSGDELGALIVGLHRVSQLGLPLLVAGAGLPSLSRPIDLTPP